MTASLAIIGAGMGGLTLAAALHQRGIGAHIYEQAPRFVRLGAGIQMSPNAMRVLRGIGIEPSIRSTAFQPHSRHVMVDWRTEAAMIMARRITRTPVPARCAAREE